MPVKQDIYWDVGASWGADIACFNSAGDEIDLTQPGTQFLFWLARASSANQISTGWPPAFSCAISSRRAGKSF